jgi:E3 ubiquitin-protein ligase UBR1
LDLSRSRLGADSIVLREVIAAELLSPRKRDSFTKHLTPTTALNLDGEIVNPTRIDTLLLYHTHLWKRPRLSLKQVYASVISISRAHKLSVGRFGSFLFPILQLCLTYFTAGHFANIYHRVIDATCSLTAKRRLPLNILHCSSSQYRLRRGTLPETTTWSRGSWLLSPPFFTNRIVDKRIAYPPNGFTTPSPTPTYTGATHSSLVPVPTSTVPIDVDSFPFKSKRFMPVFSDLRCLAQVQAFIASSPSSPIRYHL